MACSDASRHGQQRKLNAHRLARRHQFGVEAPEAMRRRALVVRQVRRIRGLAVDGAEHPFGQVSHGAVRRNILEVREERGIVRARCHAQIQNRLTHDLIVDLEWRGVVDQQPPVHVATVAIARRNAELRRPASLRA